MIIVLTFPFLVFSADASSSKKDVNLAAANGSYSVCHNVAIPPTYAVIGMATNYACSNYMEYTVALAQGGLRICNLSESIGGAPVQMPFPADFIVQSIELVQYQRSHCGGATAVYVIQPVSEGAMACSGSHIPSGWSYTGSLPSIGSCGTTVRNEIHKAVEGLRICTMSPYPNSLVIGAIEPINACDMRERNVLTKALDGIKACGSTRIPEGYVITGIDRSGQCSTYQTLTLREGHDGVVVCPQSPIPNRYVIEAAVPYGNCEGWDKGYRLKYIP
ncbi:MAG TPA: hypothetical protein VME63_14620 [Dyella sp.]|uniref:hypothetical protein n=1 Tax=Dyella sp. TaxID=1869338 RepID=UPI002D003E1B|nr:hypothetical protein [Dyella sp.]HTV86631.1 hypothetical protein [Dyella sp.]